MQIATTSKGITTVGTRGTLEVPVTRPAASQRLPAWATRAIIAAVGVHLAIEIALVVVIVRLLAAL